MLSLQGQGGVRVVQGYFAVILAFCLLFLAMPAEARVVDAGKVKVTTRSTMLADDGFGSGAIRRL